MPIIYRTQASSRDSQSTDESLNQQSDFYFTDNTESRVEDHINNGSDKYIDQTAINYSSFSEGKFEGRLAYAETSEGTAWLPFSLGGTYRPKGWYIWNGSSWVSDRNKISEALENGSGGGSSNFSGDYNDLTNKPTIPVDTNTQLSDAEIAALGYIKTFTDTNTQLSDADITALGYIKTFTDTNTQLTDADIAALGYVKTDNDTTYTNVSEFTNDSNYATQDEAIAFANGAALALEQAQKAANGKVAQTVLGVGLTNTGRVGCTSLGDGNVVEVYANGADFASGTILYREFMSLGEPIVFSGISNGAVITATEGVYGISENINGSNESPMPLMSLGLAFKDTFFYGFRNSTFGEGKIRIMNGALNSSITLFNNSGGVVRSQENIALSPWEYRVFDLDGNGEYRILSTNSVMGCIEAEFDSQRFYDLRLIMPLSTDSISWTRSGYISSPYSNVEFNYYDRAGNVGSNSVSAGAPVNLQNIVNSVADYEPDGATRIRSKGGTVWYSGADSAGLEASPAMPVSGMTQIVAQPFFIKDIGDGGNSSISIASPYEGTAKVYAWNDTTGVADLAYTVPLTRGSSVTVTTTDDQYIPASGQVANETNASNQLTGDLGAGYIISDVPITVVAQNGEQTHAPTTRSQNGTTDTWIVSDDDETLVLGYTPNSIKAEIVTDTNGFVRKRVIDALGVVSYPLV